MQVLGQGYLCEGCYSGFHIIYLTRTWDGEWGVLLLEILPFLWPLVGPECLSRWAGCLSPMLQQSPDSCLRPGWMAGSGITVRCQQGLAAWVREIYLAGCFPNKAKKYLHGDGI